MEEEHKSLVYVHIAPNGKRYVGKTAQDVSQRWRNGAGYRKCPLMWKAVQKYGWENFEHVILADNLTEEEAEALEKKYVEEYQSNNPEYGYNLTSGGEKGCVLSPEVKEQLSKSKQGHITTEETRRKISETKQRRYAAGLYDDGIRRAAEKNRGRTPYNKGKKMSVEYCAQMSESRKVWIEQHPDEFDALRQKSSEYASSRTGEKNPFYGRHHSEATKQLLFSKIKGRKVSEERRRKNQMAVFDIKWHEIRCVETGKIYNNYRSAYRDTGIQYQTIANACYRKIMRAGGYHWEPVTEANRNLPAGESLDPWWIEAEKQSLQRSRDSLAKGRAVLAEKRRKQAKEVA